MTVPMFRRLGSLPAVVLLLALAVAGCAEVAGPRTPATVLVLADEETEAGVVQMLEDAGMTVVLGPYWTYVTEADLTAQDFDAVVILAGDTGHFGFRIAGAEEAMLQFIVDGGGLVVTERFSHWPHYYPLLAATLPAFASDVASTGRETYTRVRSHAITRGLPASFSTATSPTDTASAGTDWSTVPLRPDTAAAKSVQVIYEGDVAETAVVVTGQWEQGRIVQWAMAGTLAGPDIWVPETVRLLVNSVNWAARR